MMSEDHWCLPPFLGTLFLSEYYFEIHSLQWTNKSQFNTTHFTQLLLDSQLSDGSWKQVLESNLESGNLDATIFNYWYLKSANPHFVARSNNTTVYHPQMSKARDWILKNGGIEALQTMSKFKLAAYGLYPWEDLWYIPLFIF
jgi:sporulenol synthase